MKKAFLFLFLIQNLILLAQKPCEVDTDISDSLGTYKATKQNIIFERSFAGNSTTIFFTLSNTNGILAIESQFLQRSNEFIKARCFDQNSKIFLQLNDGKIITLFYSGNDTCGSYLNHENSANNRVLSGNFIITKDVIEDLKLSPVTFMRVKFAGEMIDYPFKTELISELDQKKYEPEKYFITQLQCIEH